MIRKCVVGLERSKSFVKRTDLIEKHECRE